VAELEDQLKTDEQHVPSSQTTSELSDSYENSIGMKFVLIPDGTFEMGSPNGGDDETPVHQVTISQPFYLGTYQVTQAQWEAVMGSNPSRFKGDANCPVESISWNDVQEFIKRLNAKEGDNTYRLPTEAEWEYAARAGTITAYSFGADRALLDQYGWYNGNSGGKTHPVGQLKPNPWGLYDMHGNVGEWVEDWYADKYPSEHQTDPKGPKEGSLRVLRGGSFYDSPGGLRSADRVGRRPESRLGGYGFRCVRVPPPA
jgi:formylglycine-generating enzyme required for sulfatase activity